MLSGKEFRISSLNAYHGVVVPVVALDHALGNLSKEFSRCIFTDFIATIEIVAKYSE